jgi:MoxR-like ATPase
MNYRPTYFNKLPPNGVLERSAGQDPCDPYVFNEQIAIAVDVALATGRPLLVSGNPGCGKSRLADAVAAVQGWNLLTDTVTSRTRLESLTAEVDQLRRLNDAQARGTDQAMKPDQCYLNPGILWWALQPQSARLRGLSQSDADQYQVTLTYPGIDCGNGKPHPTVLLLDEIDKAEPDLPNDLLEPLDRGRFALPDGFRVGDFTHIDARDQAPDTDAKPATLLTIITTNRERDLPQAFLRRCVQLELPDPGRDDLIAIGHQHYPPGDSERKRKRIEAIADLIERFRRPAEDGRLRLPGTAEFLDAIQACDELDIDIDDAKTSVWRQLERAVLDKDGSLRRALGE